LGCAARAQPGWSLLPKPGASKLERGCTSDYWRPRDPTERHTRRFARRVGIDSAVPIDNSTAGVEGQGVPLSLPMYKRALLSSVIHLLVMLVGMLFQAAGGDLYGQFILSSDNGPGRKRFMPDQLPARSQGVNPIAGQTYPFVARDLRPGELLSRVPNNCLGDVSFSAEDSSKHKPLATVSVA
jgi:hypothetical protein